MCHRTKSWIIRTGVLGVTIGLILASPALATFVVPKSCRFGTGTYTGDLKGSGSDASWTTITGPDKIDKVNISMVNRIARVYANSSVSTAGAKLQINDDGSFTGEAFHQFTGNRFQVEGNFSDCVMTGTWTLTIIQPDNDDYPKDTVLHGSFEILSAGSGGGSSGGLCGVAGLGPMMLTIMSLCAFRIRRRSAW